VVDSHRVSFSQCDFGGGADSDRGAEMTKCNHQWFPHYENEVGQCFKCGAKETSLDSVGLRYRNEYGLPKCPICGKTVTLICPDDLERLKKPKDLTVDEMTKILIKIKDKHAWTDDDDEDHCLIPMEKLAQDILDALKSRQSEKEEEK